MAASALADWPSVPPHLAARLLYASPVCFLATRDRAAGGAAAGGWAGSSVNVMTVSWLTAVDNRGTFVASINGGRHTAANLGLFVDGGGGVEYWIVKRAKSPSVFAVGSSSELRLMRSG